MTRIVRAAALAAAVLLSLGGSAGAQDLGETEVEVTPTAVELDLGDTTTIEVTVANRGAAEVVAVVAHIDITDLARGGSVDPEDWSSTLSRSVGSLAAGESRTLTWELQPISPGQFTLYAVALSTGSDTVAVSGTVTIDVADRRSLDPEGILPVALAAPAVVGAALGYQIRRNKRV